MASSAEIGKQSRSPEVLWQRVAVLGRCGIAIVLLTSSVFKAIDPEPSAAFFEAIMGDPALVSGWSATIGLVAIEWVLAGLLLVLPASRLALLAVAGFFLIAAGGAAWAAIHHIEGGCGCFGAAFSVPPESAAIRAGGLAGLCIALLCVQHGLTSGSRGKVGSS